MSQLPPPPPPVQPPPGPSPSGPSRSGPAAAPAGQAGWKVATALTAVMAVLLAGTVYFFMDQRVRDLEEDLETTRQELADAQAAADSPLGGLGDLLGGLGGLGDLGDLDDLGELGDLFGLGDLLGDGLGDFDPILLQCLSGGGLGIGGQGSIPDTDIETQVEVIREIIADERGLVVDGDLDIEFVSMQEVQRRAVELTEDELDAEAAAVTSRLLAALGAVGPGTDLAQAQLEALDAGVGGFYNPETQELVIGSEQMDGMGAYITSHELVHALADATMGLPDTAALAESDGSDAAYAALNAIEGDATLYGQMFIGSHLPFDELMALESESAQTGAALAELPHFVRRELEFPYIEGMTFTCDVFLDGGWPAVDQTYAELPTTTAQILFPDRYRAGEEAVDVTSPDGPAGWDEIHHDTFGAADLLFLLEAPGGDTDRAMSDPKELVRSWAGGEATAWDQDGQTAVALVLAEHADGPDLCETVVDYYTLAFPDATSAEDAGDITFAADDQAAAIRCDDAEVALGIGPDVDIARDALT